MKILGYDYTVKYIPLADPEDFGEIDFLKSEINIHDGISKDKKISTIIHEIIEAGNYHLELELTHKQITGLEVAIFDTLTRAGINLEKLARLK